MNKENFGAAFMRATYYENMTEPSDLEKGAPQPPVERPAASDKKIFELPRPEALTVPPMDVRRAIEDRRTVRAYAQTPLTQEELAWLLWATQGVRKTSVADGMPRTWRNVPSAGGRHPFETYVIVRAVEGLVPGLYRFLALTHGLQELEQKDFAAPLVRAFRGQEFAAHAAVTFIWVADAYRTFWRYKDRAYRYFFKDAGHVCQNLCLAALPVECGVCEIGAFDDVFLSNLLGVDGTELFPVYAATVGKVRD